MKCWIFSIIICILLIGFENSYALAPVKYLPYEGLCPPGLIQKDIGSGFLCILNFECDPNILAGKLCEVDGKIQRYALPLMQLKSGLTPIQVICHEGLELIFHPTKENPACVKPSTVETLLQRGWKGSDIHNIRLFTEKGEYKIGETVNIFIENEWKSEISFGTSYTSISVVNPNGVNDRPCPGVILPQVIEILKPRQETTKSFVAGINCDKEMGDLGIYQIVLNYFTDNRPKSFITIEIHVVE